MKKKKYLPLYYEWMKSGNMGKYSALCDRFHNDYLFQLFIPENAYFLMHTTWAGEKENDYYRFGPLRQTILLFMAAMNNEL